MDLVCQPLDAGRESGRVGGELAVDTLLGLPNIVDNDVLVAGFGQPGVEESLRRLDDQCLVNVTAKGVPGVPTHRRCGSEQCVILSGVGRKLIEAARV